MAGRKQAVSIIRSSAAEYLAFVAASGQGGVEAVYADENVWLTQRMMTVLCDVDARTVNYHPKKVVSENELHGNSVIRDFRITAADGNNHDTKHYGKVTAEIAKAYAESEFEKYRIVQDRLFQSDFDRLLLQLENNLKNNKDEA